MAIQITRPDVEALIQQRLETGSFKDAEDLIFQALQPVEPEVDESVKDSRPLLSKIRDIWRDMPAEVRAKLPEDGAGQIDHYIYGLPKR
jgi:hypothetical protein